MSQKSLISCSIDLDGVGSRTGFLAVPQSTNSAGWATWRIPIAAAGDGNGPTTLLFGGNHGDEYEGPVTLMKLVRCKMNRSRAESSLSRCSISQPYSRVLGCRRSTA